MSLLNSIESKANDFQNQRYEIKTLDFLPEIHNIGRSKGYEVSIVTLYIEFRGSNDLNYDQWVQSTQLIHQFAIDTSRRILENFDGKIIDQQASGILAIWSINKANINKAVKAALSLNWLFRVKYADVLDKFPNFDYGIGIHQSKALVVKTSKPGEDYDNEEISYISPAINLVKQMSNQLLNPNCVGISLEVYQMLYDEAKTVKKSFVLIPYQKNIWNEKKIKFCNEDVVIKTTKHFHDFEEQEVKTQ